MSGYLEPPMNLRGIAETFAENTLKTNDGFNMQDFGRFQELRVRKDSAYDAST